MSRTHKTKPFWVKMRQGHLAHGEHHNHTDGVCDLPEAIEENWWKRSPTACHYEFRFTGIYTCCCPLCHGDGGWFSRKRHRQERKKQCRDWDA